MEILPDEQAEFLEALGARLARARTIVGLDAHPRRKVSQRELADVVGLTDVAVGAWESGRNEPPLFQLVRMAEHMGVRPAWIAFEDGPMRAEGAALRPPPSKPKKDAEIPKVDFREAAKIRAQLSQPERPRDKRRKRRGS